MPTMILVTGGRAFDNAIHVKETLDSAKAFYGDICIIQGGAKGADALARAWCKAEGVPCLTMDAPWDTHGRAAGAIRNGWMLKWGKPDLCIAFWGGPGTGNMIAQAEAAGIKVHRV